MNKKAHYTISPLLLLSTLGISTMTHAELIINGSFEVGSFAPAKDSTQQLAVGSTQLNGWTIQKDVISWIGKNNPWRLSASKGDFFLDLTEEQSGAPFGRVAQTIKTVSGKAYVLSFDLGSSGYWGGPAAIRASAGNTARTFTSKDSEADSEWQRFSMSFTASSSNTLVTLEGSTGTKYIGLDNVSVVENAPQADFGYSSLARTPPQVIMAGISPAIIDAKDTSFDILALVRPGENPLRSVTVNRAAPAFTTDLKHINTFKNGDQLWKTTFNFAPGAFGNGKFSLKWGALQNQFFVRATDIKTHPPFPIFVSGNYPAQMAYLDSSKNDQLNYNTTKRADPQLIMAGITPPIVDIFDTSFDIVALVRPGSKPIQDVIVNFGSKKLLNIYFKKKTDLSNGDQLWVFNHPIPAGGFGLATGGITLGTGSQEYNLQIIDSTQKTYTKYPDLLSGNYPAIP